MDVTCPCGTVFGARSSKARYCSDRCRKRKGKADVVQLPAPDPVGEKGPAFTGGVWKATHAALEEAGRVDTPLGQTCLVLARRLDFPGLDTGSAISSLAARLEQLLASATKGAGSATRPDQLRDELAERRQRHA